MPLGMKYAPLMFRPWGSLSIEEKARMLKMLPCFKFVVQVLVKFKRKIYIVYYGREFRPVKL